MFLKKSKLTFFLYISSFLCFKKLLLTPKFKNILLFLLLKALSFCFFVLDLDPSQIRVFFVCSMRYRGPS